MVQELRPQELLLRVDELLEATYRSEDLGNVDDPLDEAVFILLSRQTQAPVFRATFAALKDQYPAWLDVLHATPADLEALLAPSGFQRQRAAQLHALLQAVLDGNQDRGAGPAGSPPQDLTLDFLRELGDEEVLSYLTSLPGIGEKSARCIMSYSLDREVFAVDTHIRRIFARLGLVEHGTGKVKHAPYDALVPPSMSRRLHVNLIHHGRDTCRNRNPRCGQCVLSAQCPKGTQ